MLVLQRVKTHVEARRIFWYSFLERYFVELPVRVNLFVFTLSSLSLSPLGRASLSNWKCKLVEYFSNLIFPLNRSAF